MRSAPLGLLFLASVLGCTRAPSSVPLGGKEWVRPEPHVDRKAPGETHATRTATRPAAPPRPVEATSTALPSAPPAATAPPVRAAGIAFAFAPLAKGDIVTLRTRYTVRASLSGESFAAAGMPQTLDADMFERLEIRILDAVPEETRELEVEYVESRGTVKFGGTGMGDADSGESNAGKRYRVRLRGGAATVTPATGTLKPDEDGAVLFDLATVIGYVPLVKPHLPLSLTSGFRASVSPGELSGLFGGVQSVRFETASVALQGKDPSDPNLALFTCTLPVRFEREGIALMSRLSGTVSARPSQSRPVSVRLRGPIDADAKLAAGEGAKIAGTLEVSLEHAYRR